MDCNNIIVYSGDESSWGTDITATRPCVVLLLSFCIMFLPVASVLLLPRASAALHQLYPSPARVAVGDWLWSVVNRCSLSVSNSAAAVTMALSTLGRWLLFLSGALMQCAEAAACGWLSFPSAGTNRRLQVSGRLIWPAPGRAPAAHRMQRVAQL